MSIIELVWLEGKNNNDEQIKLFGFILKIFLLEPKETEFHARTALTNKMCVWLLSIVPVYYPMMYIVHYFEWFGHTGITNLITLSENEKPQIQHQLVLLIKLIKRSQNHNLWCPSNILSSFCKFTQEEM